MSSQLQADLDELARSWQRADRLSRLVGSGCFTLVLLGISLLALLYAVKKLTDLIGAF